MPAKTGRDRVRLMILSPFPPRLDASHGGGHVLAHFLANICARHPVAIVYMRAPDEQAIDTFFSQRCDQVEEVPRPWAGPLPLQRFSRAGRLLASLVQGEPMWVKDWESQVFSERVRLLARAWQPDIVQFELHIMAQYLPALADCPAPRVLVEYEPGLRTAPYLKGASVGLARFAHRLDQAAWARFEPAIIRQVQAVIVFTEKDHAALASLGLSVPITRIPFGIQIPEHPLNPLGIPPASLLFLGNFNHPPNIDAALRLVRDLYPRLLNDLPRLKLYIVGPNPPIELERYSSDGVIITGWVPDLMPYLDRAAVFVAPLRTGGGMRVKILEALSAGKAVVATPLAIEGLGVLDGEQVLLGESDEEIESRIRELLSDPAMRAGLAGRARAWACDNLGWDEPIAAYEQLYRKLMDGQAS